MKSIFRLIFLAAISLVLINCKTLNRPGKTEGIKYSDDDIFHITLGLIDYEIIDSSKIDTSLAESNFQYMKQNFSQDIIFNLNSSIITNSIQNIDIVTFKSIYQKKTNELILFNYLQDSTFYTVIDYESFIAALPYTTEDSIRESKMFKLDENDIKFIHGFKCRKLYISDPSDEFGNRVQTEMYLTDEIPCFLLMQLGFKSKIKGFPLEMVTNVDGVKIHYGPTFFEKNKKLKKHLIVDLKNYHELDNTTFFNRIESGSSENEENELTESEIPSPDFIPGKGTNLDIYKKMHEDEELKKFDLLTLYEDALPSLDKGSLVQILRGYHDEGLIFDKQEILNICKKYQFINEGLEKKIIEIDQIHHDSSITSSEFIRLISLMSTLELLNQQVVRDSFSKSLLFNGYQLKNETDSSFIDDYIKGKIDLADFLEGFQGIFSLDYSSPVDSGEKYLQAIAGLLEQLFNMTLSYQYLNLEKVIGRVIVKNDNLQMTYPIHKDPCYHEINYWPNNMVIPKNRNPLDIETFANVDLKLLILQIIADYELKMIIGLPSRYNLFSEIADAYKVPATDPLNGKILVVMLNKTESLDSLPPDKIPFESQLDPENRDFVSSFQSVYSQVESKSFIGYRTKEKFSKILSSKKEALNVKDFDFNNWLNEVKDSIIREMGELCASVPGLVYVRTYDNSIIEKTSSNFQQLFPEIDQYLGGKFKAENFQVHLISQDEEIVKISFESYNEEYSFSCSAYESDFEMLKIADQILKRKNINNDVHLYNIYGNEYIKYMIYLSDELKNELETEFELHFEPVD